MLKWLRGREISRRVQVIESIRIDARRSVMLVRQDNLDHLLLVGGRNELVIEKNIAVRRGGSGRGASAEPGPEPHDLTEIARQLNKLRRSSR